MKGNHIIFEAKGRAVLKEFEVPQAEDKHPPLGIVFDWSKTR